MFRFISTTWNYARHVVYLLGIISAILDRVTNIGLRFQIYIILRFQASKRYSKHLRAYNFIMTIMVREMLPHPINPAHSPKLNPTLNKFIELLILGSAPGLLRGVVGLVTREK